MPLHRRARPAAHQPGQGRLAEQDMPVSARTAQRFRVLRQRVEHVVLAHGHIRPGVLAANCFITAACAVSTPPTVVGEVGRASQLRVLAELVGAVLIRRPPVTFVAAVSRSARGWTRASSPYLPSPGWRGWARPGLRVLPGGDLLAQHRTTSSAEQVELVQHGSSAAAPRGRPGTAGAGSREVLAEGQSLVDDLLRAADRQRGSSWQSPP